MSPESGRARAILLRLLLSALSWLPAGIAVAATPKAGEKRICVPSADGKAWECGPPDNPPPERGLPAVTSVSYYVKSFRVEGELPDYLAPLRRAADVVRLCFKPPQA